MKLTSVSTSVMGIAAAALGIVSMVAMAVVAVIMRLSISFRSEPILDVETFRFRIVMTSIEQLRWIDGTILRNDLRGAGVQNPQPSLKLPKGIGLDEVRFGDE